MRELLRRSAGADAWHTLCGISPVNGDAFARTLLESIDHMDVAFCLLRGGNFEEPRFPWIAFLVWDCQLYNLYSCDPRSVHCMLVGSAMGIPFLRISCVNARRGFVSQRKVVFV